MSVGSDPWAIAVTPDGLHAYVATAHSGIEFIDTATNAVTAAIDPNPNDTERTAVAAVPR